MNYNLKLDFERKSKSHISTHSLLMKELKTLRKKLMTIPFPFCELECAWISVCTKNQPLECIINLLREANQELQVLDADRGSFWYTWE